MKITKLLDRLAKNVVNKTQKRKNSTAAVFEKIKTRNFLKMRKGLKLPIKLVYEPQVNNYVIFR